jgi:hypothetical protein
MRDQKQQMKISNHSMNLADPNRHKDFQMYLHQLPAACMEQEHPPENGKTMHSNAEMGHKHLSPENV